MQLVVSCLIGVASLITPQTIDDYKSCRWFSNIAEHTAQAHHAIVLYLPEKEWEWAIKVIWCESSGRNSATSHANARGIWQYLPKTEKWLEKKLGENFNVRDPYDATYMTSWLLRNDTNPKRHWSPSKNCWDKNIVNYSIDLHN